MRRKVLRWIVSLIAGAVLLALLVVTGAWFYTQTAHFHALLRAKLMAAINDSVNGEVKVKEVTGSIWGRLRFYELAVVQDGNPVLSAPVVSVELGLLGQIYSVLSAAGIHIGEIEITKPELKLAQDQDHNWNIAALLKKRDQAEEPGRLTISFGAVKITDGTINVAMAGGRKARISSLRVDGGVVLLPSGLEINLDNLNFALASAGLPGISWASTLAFKESGKTSVVTAKRVEVLTDRSHFSITGTVTDVLNPTVRLTVDLKKGSAQELRRLLPAVPLRQDISGTVFASGPLSALKLSGTLKAPDGEILTSVTSNWKQSEPGFRGTLQVKEFFLERVLSVSELSGEVNGKFFFQGSSLAQAQASGSGAVSGLLVQGWNLGDTTLSGELNHDQVVFAAQSSADGGKVDVSGTVALTATPAYEATVHARSLNSTRIVITKAGIPRANLSFDAWVKGRGTNLQTMQADGRITLYPSRIENVALERGRAEGSIRDGVLALREVRLVAEGTTLNARGSIASFKRGATGNISYQLNARNITPWLALAGVEGGGGVTAKGSISGSLESPKVEGEASLTDFRLAKVHWEKGAISWTLAGSDSSGWRGRVDVAARKLTAGISLSSVDAQISLEGTHPTTLGAQVVARDPGQRVHRVKGRLVYDRGRADLRLQELALQLPNGVWRNARPARFLVHGKGLTAQEFVLQHGSQTVSVKGILGFQGAQDFYVQANHFPLQELQPYLKSAPAVAGNLSLTIRVRGTAAQPLMEGKVSADQLRIADQNYAGLAGEGSYRKERLNLNLRLLQDTRHTLSVNGVIPVYLGWSGDQAPALLGESDLRIHSDGLSPAFLAAASKDIDRLQGSLSVDISLRGPVHNLVPSGTIQFQNGAARVVPLGLSLSEIGLQARVTPGAIQITRLVARSGNGQLTGAGRLALKGYQITEIGLKLNAQEFPVIGTRQYNAAASGTLVALGTLQQPLVRGDLALKGILRPDIALLMRSGKAAQDPTIMVVRTEAELAKADEDSKEGRKTNNGVGGGISEEKSPRFLKLGMDITARVNNGTWIYVDDGSVEITGLVRIRKQPEEDWTIAGDLHGRNGWYSFHGRRFRIEKADLMFTGGESIDPRLDVVARHRVASYQIDAVVGGYLSKPTLTLRSDPRLEQADILSVLLFGKPTSQLTKGQQDTLQSQALKTAADFIASDLTQSVARRVGVDTLEFNFGDNLGDGGIGVGKYVTEDVFVSATQQFGDQRQQQYSVEYNITPSWQIKSSTNPEGESGIDIFWRKQY